MSIDLSGLGVVFVDAPLPNTLPVPLPAPQAGESEHSVETIRETLNLFITNQRDIQGAFAAPISPYNFVLQALVDMNVLRGGINTTTPANQPAGYININNSGSNPIFTVSDGSAPQTGITLVDAILLPHQERISNLESREGVSQSQLDTAFNTLQGQISARLPRGEFNVEGLIDGGVYQLSDFGITDAVSNQQLDEALAGIDLDPQGPFDQQAWSVDRVGEVSSIADAPDSDYQFTDDLPESPFGSGIILSGADILYRADAQNFDPEGVLDLTLRGNVSALPATDSVRFSLIISPFDAEGAAVDGFDRIADVFITETGDFTLDIDDDKRLSSYFIGLQEASPTLRGFRLGFAHDLGDVGAATIHGWSETYARPNTRTANIERAVEGLLKGNVLYSAFLDEDNPFEAACLAAISEGKQLIIDVPELGFTDMVTSGGQDETGNEIPAFLRIVTLGQAHIVPDDAMVTGWKHHGDMNMTGLVLDGKAVDREAFPITDPLYQQFDGFFNAQNCGLINYHVGRTGLRSRPIDISTSCTGADVRFFHGENLFASQFISFRAPDCSLSNSKFVNSEQHGVRWGIFNNDLEIDDDGNIVSFPLALRGKATHNTFININESPTLFEIGAHDAEVLYNDCDDCGQLTKFDDSARGKVLFNTLTNPKPDHGTRQAIQIDVSPLTDDPNSFVAVGGFVIEENNLSTLGDGIIGIWTGDIIRRNKIRGGGEDDDAISFLNQYAPVAGEDPIYADGVLIEDNEIDFLGRGIRVTGSNSIIRGGHIRSGEDGITWGDGENLIVEDIEISTTGDRAIRAVSTATNGVFRRIDLNGDKSEDGIVASAANGHTITDIIKEGAEELKIVDADQFGVVYDGDGEGGGTEQTAEMQAFLDAIAGTGMMGTISGIVRCDSQLSGGGNTRIVGLGDAAIDNTNYDGEGANGSVVFSSVLGTRIPLTGDAAEGGRDVPIPFAAMPTEFSGDFTDIPRAMCLISDDAEFSDSGSGAIVSQGEINFVESAAGSSAQVHIPLRHTYTAGQNAFLQPILQIARNITIEGLRIIGNKTIVAGTNQNIGFRFNHCQDVILDNARVDHHSGFASSFVSCYNFKVLNTSTYRSRTTTTGYGVAVIGASESFMVSNDGAGNRHHFSAAAGVTEDGTRRGAVRNGTVINTNAFASGSALDTSGVALSGGDAIDCHSNTDNISFINITVNGSSNSGFNYEGRNPNIVNCTALNVSAHGFFITNRTVLDSVVRVQGRVDGYGSGTSTTYSALRILNGFAAGRGPIREVYADIVFANGKANARNAVEIRNAFGQPRIERGKLTINGRASSAFDRRAIFIEGLDGAQIEGDVDVLDAIDDIEILQLDGGDRCRFNLGGTSRSLAVDLNTVTNSVGQFALVGTDAGDGVNLSADSEGNNFLVSAVGFNRNVRDLNTNNTLLGDV